MGKKAQDLWVLSVYVFECRGLDEAVGQGDQFYIAWYVFVKCTLRAEIVRIFFFWVIVFQQMSTLKVKSLNFYEGFRNPGRCT
jgi:hypothetical protein